MCARVSCSQGRVDAGDRAEQLEGGVPALGFDVSAAGRVRVCGREVIHGSSMQFAFVKYEGDTSGPFTNELQSSSVHVRRVMFGFDLKATYDFGDDYPYDHIWRFHEDGQFGSTIVVQGRGEEIHGWGVVRLRGQRHPGPARQCSRDLHRRSERARRDRRCLVHRAPVIARASDCVRPLIRARGIPVGALARRTPNVEGTMIGERRSSSLSTFMNREDGCRSASETVPILSERPARRQ
jgi:hypothetical protein